MSYRNFLTGAGNQTENTTFNEFYNECALFKRLVDKDSTLTQDDMEEIQREFQKKYPEKNFQEFLTDCHLHEDDVCVDERVFDTSLKKMCIPHIYSAVNRKQTSNFNMQEFLRDSISNNQTYYLNFDPDPEFDIDDEDNFEEKNKQLILADQALKSIGTIALCLNKQRKEIPYTLMDVKAENYIN